MSSRVSSRVDAVIPIAPHEVSEASGAVAGGIVNAVGDAIGGARDAVASVLGTLSKEEVERRQREEDVDKYRKHLCVIYPSAGL